MGYSVESVDGWYQVIDRDKSVHSGNGDTNGGHRLAATEQFINGSPEPVLCGVVEDMLNIMQDTMTGVAKLSCGTVDGRAAAVVLANRLHLSIDTLFDPPESILLMMASVLGMVKDNLGRLDGDARKDYVRFVTRHLIRTYDNMVGYDLKYGRREKVVAGFTFDDFMFEVMIHGGSFLDRLERLGIGTVIDGPEEVFDPDTVIAFSDIEHSFKNINIGFALLTRPSDLGLRKALGLLPGILSTGINGRLASKCMLTWRTLAYDWDDDGLNMVLHGGPSFGYAHAVTLMLEGKDVRPDKVGMILDRVFLPRGKTGRTKGTSLHGRFDRILTDANRTSDMELLKALAWIVLLLDKVVGRDGQEDHTEYVVSYSAIMSALDHYDKGLPWPFIAETLKASLRKSVGGHGRASTEAVAIEDGLLVSLVGFP